MPDSTAWTRTMHRRLSWDIIPDWLEDSSAFAESEYVDLEEIFLATVACIIVGVLCILGFSCLRRKYDCYEPRKRVQPDHTLPSLPKDSLFGWIPALLRIQEDEVLKTAGLDAVVHIRMYYLGLRIFAVFSVYSLLVLLPINYTGGERYSSSYDLTDFDYFSINNISSGSPRMWFHVVGIYLLTFIAMYELRFEYQYFIALRHEFLIGDPTYLRTVLVEKIPPDLRSCSKITAYFETMYPGAVDKVVPCQDLATLDSAVAARDSAQAWLERALLQRELRGRAPHHYTMPWCRRVDSVSFYTELLAFWNSQVAKEQAKARAISRRIDRDGGVPSSPYVQDLMRLHKVSSREGSSKKERERLLAEKREKGYGDSDDESDEEDGVSVSGEKEPEAGTEDGRFWWLRWALWWVYNAFASLLTDATPMERRTLKIQERYRVMLPKAFVVFKTYAAAAMAKQALHAVVPGTMVVEQAPEPQDILWDNLYVSRTTRTYRLVLVETLVVILLVIYVVPVTLIELVVGVDALETRYSWVSRVASESTLFNMLLSTLQPACLVLLMTTLPPLFFLLGRIEGQSSLSEISKSTFCRYYAFQVINVFLVTTIAGSVLDSLYDILQDPSQTFYLLGQSLPKVGGFFCEYVFLKAFASLPLELSRLVQYAQTRLKKYLTWHLTAREKRSEYLGCRDLMKPYWFNYGKYIPQDQLVTLVAMTYSVVAPLILIPCICFFCMAVLVYKHQLLFVYDTQWQTGGQFWVKVFRRYIFAMFLGQATLIGVLALKEAYTECYVTALLMIKTAAYAIIMHEVYIPSGDRLPLELATSVDHNKKTALRDDPLPGSDEYIQPSVRVPAEMQPEPQPDQSVPYVTEAASEVPKEERGHMWACF